jgi:hypothetical protein
LLQFLGKRLREIYILVDIEDDILYQLRQYGVVGTAYVGMPRQDMQVMAPYQGRGQQVGGQDLGIVRSAYD